MIREEISRLKALGPFPESKLADDATISEQEKLLAAIKRPVTNEEAKILVGLFGPDDYYGGAWTVLHLIESAPNWPIDDCLTNTSNEWIIRLKERAQKGGGKNNDS